MFPTEFRVRVCEDNTLTIMCDDGGYIQITFANYGRLDYTTCTFFVSVRNNCKARQSLSIVADMCNGSQQCEIEASDKIFGDSCRFADEYLEVRYIVKKVTIHLLEFTVRT